MSFERFYFLIGLSILTLVPSWYSIKLSFVKQSSLFGAASVVSVSHVSTASFSSSLWLIVLLSGTISSSTSTESYTVASFRISPKTTATFVASILFVAINSLIGTPVSLGTILSELDRHILSNPLQSNTTSHLCSSVTRITVSTTSERTLCFMLVLQFSDNGPWQPSTQLSLVKGLFLTIASDTN